MTAALEGGERVSITPRPHFTPRKDPVPILQEAGWAPGPVWTGGKSRPHEDSIPDRPARSQSLYRLSYRAQWMPTYIIKRTRWFLLRMRNVSDKSCGQNQNTNLISHNPFSPLKNHAIYEIMWKNAATARHAREGNIIWRMRIEYCITNP